MRGASIQFSGGGVGAGWAIGAGGGGAGGGAGGPAQADSGANAPIIVSAASGAESGKLRFAVMRAMMARRRRWLKRDDGAIAGIMAKKQRIDQLLVARGLAESRARAQALVMAGLVYLGDRKVDKPGQPVAEDAAIELKGRDHPWVSRGGIKLAHALDHFALDPAGAVAMDIGSSTGGFTDVLLSRGADHVFAVDSGTNQLAWKLRQDPRVSVLEQTSARILTPDHITRSCGWVVCDASFISLRKVLETPLNLAAPRCRLVALIKPQFEVTRAEVGKGGVVRDPALHARVCAEVREWLEAAGWRIDGIVESPITGPEGNVEFLIAARREG